MKTKRDRDRKAREAQSPRTASITSLLCSGCRIGQCVGRQYVPSRYSELLLVAELLESLHYSALRLA